MELRVTLVLKHYLSFRVIVAAGSVVISDIKDNNKVAGVPAKEKSKNI